MQTADDGADARSDAGGKDELEEDIGDVDEHEDLDRLLGVDWRRWMQHEAEEA